MKGLQLHRSVTAMGHMWSKAHCDGHTWMSKAHCDESLLVPSCWCELHACAPSVPQVGGMGSWWLSLCQVGI